jgi:hypothetical protein
MRVICAWCQQQGRSGLLRVREPLEDTTETHGICERHQQEVFEALPSPSFPSTRWLFIVRANDMARYEHLSTLLRNVAGATVILDRRQGERRHRDARPTPDQRKRDRRVRRPETTSLGYALVRFAGSEPNTSGSALSREERLRENVTPLGDGPVMKLMQAAAACAGDDNHSVRHVETLHPVLRNRRTGATGRTT